MSTVLDTPTAAAPAVRASLLRAEARRFRSRRMVRVLVALGLLGLLVAVGVAATQFAQPSAAGLAQATARRDQQVQQQHLYRQQCLDSADKPAGVAPEEYCGPELTVDDVGPVSSYVAKRPFSLDEAGRAGVLGVGGAAAALAFLIGATYVGAEWSSRSMVALLFWEPRRLTVMGTKLAVLGAGAALLGVVAEALWLLAARLLVGLRGDPRAKVPAHVWHDLLQGSGRAVLLVVLLGLIGFGAANLLRNTAAALGVAFVYVVVLENVVRAVRPHWQTYLLTDNALALLDRDGRKLYFDESFVDARGFFQSSGHEVVVHNLHGAVVLAVVTAVVVGVGVLLFTRRDLD